MNEIMLCYYVGEARNCGTTPWQWKAERVGLNYWLHSPETKAIILEHFAGFDPRRLRRSSSFHDITNCRLRKPL